MGTAIVFLVLLPIVIVIAKAAGASSNQRARNGEIVHRGGFSSRPVSGFGHRPRRTHRNKFTPGQVIGLVGGAWAVHEMVQDHHRSERMGEDIEHAQFWAGQHETFGSPEYYHAVSERLHHHR